MANRGSGREREEQEGGGSPSGFKGELSPINSRPFSRCHIGLWGNGSQLSLVPFSRQSRCYKIRWAPCCGAETPSQEARGRRVPTCVSLPASRCAGQPVEETLQSTSMLEPSEIAKLLLLQQTALKETTRFRFSPREFSPGLLESQTKESNEKNSNDRINRAVKIRLRSEK